MNKKIVVILGSVCAALLLILIVCGRVLGNDKGELLPRPDKINIYANGKLIELKDTDTYFEDIYKINRAPQEKKTTETCIEENTISEIKSGELAVEYIYLDQQTMELDTGNREYHKLLFVYSGWCSQNVIFFQGDYQSGTIEHGVMGKSMQKLVDKIMQK